MIFAFFLVKARYHWSQIVGVLICIAGLGLIVISDWTTDKVRFIFRTKSIRWS
jgi:solute carrier family 35 protein F1/2